MNINQPENPKPKRPGEKHNKIIFEVGIDIDKKSIAKVKKELTELENNLLKEEVGYKILTKDKYIEYRLCGIDPWRIKKDTIKVLQKQWDKLRKGYEFVILAGDMIYDVDYFNKYVLDGKLDCYYCIREENISNVSIEGFYKEVLSSDDGIEQIVFRKIDECNKRRRNYEEVL